MRKSGRSLVSATSALSGATTPSARGSHGLRRLWAVLLLAPWGCGLVPFDVLGLKCSDDRPCGEDLVCVDGRCAASKNEDDGGTIDAGTEDGGDDGGPGLPKGVNLLKNPGFEDILPDGGIAGWMAPVGVLRSAAFKPNFRSGARAARLSSPDNSVPILRPSQVLTHVALGAPMCGAIWVRGDIDGGTDVVLNIREFLTDGGTAYSADRHARAQMTWTRLETPVYRVQDEGSVILRLVADKAVEATESVFADDAWLSISVDGGCP